MAWNTPYATKDTYKARVRKASSADDTAIDDQCEAASQFINRAAGGRSFNRSDPGETRIYRGRDRARLGIDDLVTLTSCEIDTANDGTYATAIPIADLDLLPLNAAERVPAEPYRQITLARDVSIGVFPANMRVRLTGTWGWPAVPMSIVEYTILVVRTWRDLEESGYTLQAQSVDQLVTFSPEISRMVETLKRTYRRNDRLPL